MKRRLFFGSGGKSAPELCGVVRVGDASGVVVLSIYFVEA
jgi:hypothetical protein